MLLSAVLEQALTAIVLTFDVATDREAHTMERCAELLTGASLARLTSGGIASLGTWSNQSESTNSAEGNDLLSTSREPICYWTSPTHIRILLPYESRARLQHELEIRPGRISRLEYPWQPPYSSGVAAIEPPVSPLLPVAAIDAPAQVSPCPEDTPYGFSLAMQLAPSCTCKMHDFRRMYVLRKIMRLRVYAVS